MDSANYEVEVAMIQALRADSAVVGHVGNRVYDRPPDNHSEFPYIAFGPSDDNSIDAECIETEEITFQIDVYSRGGGRAFGSAQAKTIARVVKRVLHNAELDLSDNAIADVQHNITRYQRESDGITNRAILSVTATVELS